MVVVASAAESRFSPEPATDALFSFERPERLNGKEKDGNDYDSTAEI